MSEALSLAFKGSKNHRKRIRLTRRTRQMLKMGLRQPPPRCEPSQTRYQRFHATKTRRRRHLLDWATSERRSVSDGVSPKYSRYLTARVYAAM